MGRKHCGAVQAVTRKEKYARQKSRTEANRIRKQRKHFKKHPNHIRGVEKLREALGIN